MKTKLRILHFVILLGLSISISGCSGSVPAKDYFNLGRYRPFGMSKVCENKPTRIELIQRLGDYAIWKVASETENVDRYILADSAKSCDISFSYMTDPNVRSNYVDQTPTLTQYILFSPETSQDSLLSDWNFLDSSSLQATVLSERFSICEQRIGVRLSVECRTEVYQWIQRRVLTLSFSIRGESDYYYPRLDIVDGEVYWEGEKLL